MISLFPWLAFHSKLLRQRGVAVLLVSFAADLAFHTISPFVTNFSPKQSVVRISDARTQNLPLDPDCGIPEHESAVPHHNHLPALISHADLAIPPVAVNSEERDRATPAPYSPRIARLIRAPPRT